MSRHAKPDGSRCGWVLVRWGMALVLATCLTAAARGDDPAAAVHTLLAPVWDADPTLSPRHRGMLAREIVRQGLLMAAREEFGLATRDRCLREPLPGKPPAGMVKLDLVSTIVGGDRALVVIHPANGADGAPLLEERFRLDGERLIESLAALSERLARTKFADALEQSGCNRPPRPPRGSA